ncbi:hypothetical protein ACFRCQ_24840 [Cytobacillus firmus]|uniref:hypothetical protein n=1 Tax=Cytobacillus firmus TaxID=1399 RepID=UPI003690BA8B
MPAYLLEERVDKNWNHDNDEDKKQLQSSDAKSYSRDDMAAMLEELLKIVKSDDDAKKKQKRDDNF